MKIVEDVVTWNDPNDSSVAIHKVYYAPEAEIISQDGSTPFVEVTMPTCELNLAELPINTNGENYNLALVAVDARGNESNLSPVLVRPLDNTPPATPSWL